MVSYVKFMRCTQAYFNNLTKKDVDTLYFVASPTSADNGFLYLGTRLISGTSEKESSTTNGYISINEVKDILIKENLADNDILLYNEGTKKWENHALQDLLVYSAMVGATETKDGIAGLVPVPIAGDQLKFLSGDGTWKEINTYDAELHAVVKTLVAYDPDMSVREIADEVVMDVRSRVGSLEKIIKGSGSDTDLGLSARVSAIENTIGEFQPVSPNYLDIGEAISYFDTSITELNDRLRWHTLSENL